MCWFGQFFLASTEKSYDAFCPFAFQDETQKNSENVDVQMIQRGKKRSVKKQSKETRLKDKKNLELCLPHGT